MFVSHSLKNAHLSALCFVQLNQKLVEFVEVNERIRQELYHRDRQAELKSCMNKAIVANSEAERRDATSRSRSRSPTRQGAYRDTADKQ